MSVTYKKKTNIIEKYIKIMDSSTCSNNITLEESFDNIEDQMDMMTNRSAFTKNVIYFTHKYAFPPCNTDDTISIWKQPKKCSPVSRNVTLQFENSNMINAQFAEKQYRLSCGPINHFDPDGYPPCIKVPDNACIINPTYPEYLFGEKKNT